MKKTLSFLFVFLLFSSITFSQMPGIGVGGNLALPIGDWSDIANIGFGGTATYEHKFSPNLLGTATAGYLIWGGKEDFVGGSFDYSAIPILAGVKYFFTPGSGFYAAGQAGFHLFTVDVEIDIFGFKTSSSASETEFSFAAGAGYEIPVGPKGAVDLNAMFNVVSDLNYLGFRVAYKFALN